MAYSGECWESRRAKEREIWLDDSPALPVEHILQSAPAGLASHPRVWMAHEVRCRLTVIGRDGT
jgi:hypothetical protein